MNKIRRRVKRLVGLDKPSPPRHQGGLELFLPSQITGWIVPAKEPFHEVRLLAGSQLISRCEINQPRKDVSDQLGFEGNAGFSLPISILHPSVDLDQPIRVLAISVDGKRQAELLSLFEPDRTAEKIKDLLQSDYLGIEGHFDGLVLGAIQGWAARRYQRVSTRVWLQSEGLEPIALVCNHYRPGMESLDLPNECGFSLRLDQLPDSWRGKSVHCSLDKEGKFTLPQIEPVSIPEAPIREPLSPAPVVSADSYLSQIEHSSDELRVHWEQLEMLRVLLDEVELRLDRQEEAEAKAKALPKKSSWWRRWLGRG